MGKRCQKLLANFFRFLLKFYFVFFPKFLISFQKFIFWFPSKICLLVSFKNVYFGSFQKFFWFSSKIFGFLLNFFFSFYLKFLFWFPSKIFILVSFWNNKRVEQVYVSCYIILNAKLKLKLVKDYKGNFTVYCNQYFTVNGNIFYLLVVL